ncbi:MAG: hypothetical protein ACPGXI_16940 [Mycobacterium sp.]
MSADGVLHAGPRAEEARPSVSGTGSQSITGEVVHCSDVGSGEIRDDVDDDVDEVGDVDEVSGVDEVGEVMILLQRWGTVGMAAAGESQTTL